MNALDRMYRRMDARKDYIAYSKAERDHAVERDLASQQAARDFTLKNRELVATRLGMKLPKMELE